MKLNLILFLQIRKMGEDLKPKKVIKFNESTINIPIKIIFNYILLKRYVFTYKER